MDEKMIPTWVIVIGGFIFLVTVASIAVAIVVRNYIRERKLPKFYIRDLFWLVLVCALLCGFHVWGMRLQNHYYSEFRKLADIMEAQDAWRKEYGALRRFVEADGYKVNWKAPGSIEMVRPDGTSEVSGASTAD